MAVQVPCLHSPAQALSHPPQCSALLCVSLSQPFVASPSQSAYPASHVIWHAPELQLGDPWLARQVTPQAPQLTGSVCRSTSHASVALWLQSPLPWLQRSDVHSPLTHMSAPSSTAHGASHAPQCEALLARLTSQPSATLWLQSAHPASQTRIAQPSLAHVAIECGRLQVPPHTPQSLTLSPSFDSHPFGLVSSQSGVGAGQFVVSQSAVRHPAVPVSPLALAAPPSETVPEFSRPAPKSVYA